MDDLDELLRALSNKERRRILNICWREARPAGEIAESSALAIASVSEHLKVLRKTGLLTLEKSGRHWLYMTDRKKVSGIIKLLGQSMGAKND